MMSEVISKRKFETGFIIKNSTLCYSVDLVSTKLLMIVVDIELQWFNFVLLLNVNT